MVILCIVGGLAVFLISLADPFSKEATVEIQAERVQPRSLYARQRLLLHLLPSTCYYAYDYILQGEIFHGLSRAVAASVVQRVTQVK